MRSAIAKAISGDRNALPIDGTIGDLGWGVKEEVPKKKCFEICRNDAMKSLW